MPTLSLTKNYADATLLLAADFDVFLDELETFLNDTKVTDTNIQDDGITASDKLLTASVTTAKILNNAVTTVKIADQAVATGKINTSAVTTAKIADANVTTAKIADSAVTTDKILAANVTRAKLRTMSYGSSSASSGTTSTSSISLVGTVSITTSGRPVLLFLDVGTGTSASYIELGYPANGVALNNRLKMHGIFYRDASIISYSNWSDNPLQDNYIRTLTTYQVCRKPPGIFAHIDTPAAGTYTYSFYLNNPVTGFTVNWTNVKLVAVEL